MSIVPVTRLSASDLTRLGNNLPKLRRRRLIRPLVEAYPPQQLLVADTASGGRRDRPLRAAVLR